MLRKYWILVLLLALALAGCGGAAPVETAQVSNEPYASATTASQAATAAPVATQPAAPVATESQATGSQAPAGCTVVSPQPTPGPTEQSIFPPVSDQDWTQGPDTATVTLTEYSDFQ